MIDSQAQSDFDSLLNTMQIQEDADRFRLQAMHQGLQSRNHNTPYRQKNILCLSGGGSYGSFSAGVLYAWTQQRTRPEFDVVTGISTGALIAPFAFLGSRYDEELKRFYTELESKDLYKSTPIRGLFGEGLADNSKLAKQVEDVLNPQMLCELAQEHRKGRRLYIGTTAAESKRFVIWDIGAIAARGTPNDRDLIKQILLGSSAIPGFFPPQHITVDLDGKCLTERHVDGGASTAIFMQPPHLDPEHRSANPNHDLAGANVYCIVAGKLFADPQKISRVSLAIAAQEISAIIYAQTRGDLQRLFTTCMLTGMNFHMTSIPDSYPAPASSTAFEKQAMVGMFNEGCRLVNEGIVWRRTAPGLEPGESANIRRGTNLTYQQRGPIIRSGEKGSPFISDRGIPALPEIK